MSAVPGPRFDPKPVGRRKAPTAPTNHELFAAARVDLLWFVIVAFQVLHPGRRFIMADYLAAMATLLMGIEKGPHTQLIFNLPPRHMKSMMVSVMYVAWRLGRDPTAKFICVSYSDSLAHELSALTRKLMESPLYRAIFPGTRLDKRAVDHIKTTKGGQRFATKVGSDITGFGAEEVILDDLMQPDEASSERVKEEIRAWVDSSVMNRFEEIGIVRLILVMHRLAPDDISATLEATREYYVLRLPFVAETDETILGPDGDVLLRRLAGETLNSDRTSDEAIRKLRARTPKHVWDSQWQQKPSIGGSGMLSINLFRRYPATVRKRDFDALIHSWDIGGTISGNATVCTKWGVMLRDQEPAWLYLHDVLTARRQLPEIQAMMMAEDRRDRPGLIVVDERGIGLGIYQFLRDRGYRHLWGSSATSEPLERAEGPGLKPSMSKIDRFGRAALVIDDGRVFIPEEAPWLESFLSEVAAFPNIPDDDQVDSMTQLLGNIDWAVRKATLIGRPSNF